jgi:hypothetical protein
VLREHTGRSATILGVLNDLVRQVQRLLAQPSVQRFLLGVVLAVVVVLLVRRLFGRPTRAAHLTTKRCPHCGWVGTVSRHKPICPKCAKSLGGDLG